jgi:hypothetical protein
MKYLILLFFGTFLTTAFASELDLFGFRPYVSLSKTMGPRWEGNVFYAETINDSNSTFGGQRFVPRDLQSYFQTGLTYKQNPHLNFTAGYVFQRNNPLYQNFVNENRLWQQMIVSHAISYFSLSHRFRFEERFIQNRATKNTDPMATRLRYQLNFVAPLQGKEIDPGEFFFSAYNEFYFSTTGVRNAFYSENWSYAGFGFQTAKFGRIELGPLLQWAVIDRERDTRRILLVQLGWSYTF